MKKFPQKLMVLIILFAVFFSTSSTHNTVFAVEKKVFKIGAILPLSGSMSFAGEEVRNALELAVKEDSSEKHLFKIIFQDNSLQGRKSATLAQKLISQDKVDALITLWPESANIVAPISEKAGVLHYTIAWDPEIACSHKLILSHQAMLDDYAKTTLKILQKNSVHNLAFFHDSVFQQGADKLKLYADQFGVKIQEIYLFDRGQTDFRTEIIKAQKSNTDAFLIWSTMPETETFLKQAKELKTDKFITGFFDVVQDLSTIEGLSFASEVYSTSEFKEDYKKAYGSEPVMKGANAFDIIKLLSKAIDEIEISGSKIPAEKIKEQLVKTKDYHGAVGTVSIDQCGNSSYPVVTKRVIAGKIEVVAD